MQAGVQHELLPGLSLTGTYTRHWWGNFLVTKNRLVNPSDYSPYCVTAPVDSRLPGGGGTQICSFYDINPDKFGQVYNRIMFAHKFGNMTDVYNGVDVAANVRLPRGILLQGGFSTGREAINTCDIVGKVDNPAAAVVDVNHSSATSGNTTPLVNITGVASPSLLYCNNIAPYQTQVKLFGSYQLPWGLAASAALQSIPGPQIAATYTATNAQIAPSLGRNLAAGPNATATVQLIAPGTLYSDRLNQLDLRLARTFRVGGGRRLQGQFDLYNLLNVGPALGLNNTYGSAWLTPTVLPIGRMAKLGVQFDF
jgi:hypothetical protein